MSNIETSAVFLEDIRNVRLPNEDSELSKSQLGLRTRVTGLLVRQAIAIDPSSLVRNEARRCIGITMDMITSITAAAKDPDVKRLPSVCGGTVRIEGLHTASIELLDAVIASKYSSDVLDAQE